MHESDNMDEMQYLINSNPWIVQEKRPLWLQDIYVCEDISKWKKYDIFLSTDKNDHLIEYNTLKRIIEVIPQNIHWDGRFILGVELSKESWKNQLKEYISNKSGKICFLNFEKHKLTKAESQIYLEKEKEKKHIVDELLRNAKLSIENKDATIIMSTSSDPVKYLTVGCPPQKCDILITRSEFVDAIPESCLQKYVKENGVVIHFGRLEKSKKDITSTTYIDAIVLPNLDTHNNWAPCFRNYVSVLIS